MHLPKRHISKHRRARLVAWSLAMLAWLAWVFSADRAPKRRHMRRRYGLMSLDRLAQMLALLIVVRAGELACTGRYRANPFFNRVRGRQAWPRHALRATIGGRLRRALKHKCFTTRVAILTDAARRLDAWAAPYVDRLRLGMTRLWSVRTKPRPAAPLIWLAATSAFFADTS
jgi:hypothetical protein